MDSQHLPTMIDFYYSLLVSVLIQKKHAPTLTIRERKNHIFTWLNETKKKKTFSKIVLNEISWLQEEISIRTCDQLEVMLATIFHASIKLHEDSKSNKVTQ
ncbi:hypothetical protein ACIUVT_000906 [Yersinia enterocolitica]